jgi:hypothetical protein
MNQSSKWISTIGLIASLISIFAFVTGVVSLEQLLRTKTTGGSGGGQVTPTAADVYVHPSGSFLSGKVRLGWSIRLMYPARISASMKLVAMTSTSTFMIRLDIRRTILFAFSISGCRSLEGWHSGPIRTRLPGKTCIQ